jgi:hypothetical protein
MAYNLTYKMFKNISLIVFKHQYSIHGIIKYIIKTLLRRFLYIAICLRKNVVCHIFVSCQNKK